MRLVLDTNAYCLCDTGHESALEHVEQAREIFIPVIVYGELYYGFKHGNRFKENMRRLEKFVSEFGAQVINVDREVAEHFGDIYSKLREKGKPIPTNDIWIAACCFSVGGKLLTADSHFKGVDQIPCEILG